MPSSESGRFGSVADQLVRRASGTLRATNGVPFLAWFVLLVVAAHLLTVAGILPPLDWLPGEPVR